MPVQQCQSDNKPGFKWGPQGKCYTYTAGDEASRERARGLAEEQGRAIEAEGGKSKPPKGFWKSLFENQYKKLQQWGKP